MHCAKDEPVETDSKIEEPTKPEEESPGEESSEPDTEVYFTYSSYANSDSNNWVVVHTPEGDLLDYGRVEDGGPLEFRAHKDSIPEKITVTRLFYNIDPGGNQYHDLLTYEGLSSGHSWNDVFSSPQRTIIGTFDLRIENIPGIKGSTLSTNKGALNAADSNIEGNFVNTKLILTGIPIYQNENYSLSIYDNSGGHKYLPIPNPVDASSSVIDYSEFLEFDDYLEIDLPAFDFALLFTYGYAEENPNYALSGQVFGNYLEFNSSGPIRAGYLDNYKNYRTDFSITQGDFSYGFSTNQRLDEINIPSRPSFTLENSSVYDLDFSTDLNFIAKNTRHRFVLFDDNQVNTTTRWLVYSASSNNHNIGQLPDEIIMEFPDFNLENLELEAVNLTTKGFSLEETFENANNNERTGNFFTEGFGYEDFE